MEWNRDTTLTLIEEYRCRPGLWDLTHSFYRKKGTKKELLEEIAAKFHPIEISILEIEKKFHTLRTQFHREVSRMGQTRGSEPYKSKWFAFKHLQFLSSPNACRIPKNAGMLKVENHQPLQELSKSKVSTASDRKLSSDGSSAGEKNVETITTATRMHSVSNNSAETTSNSEYFITEIKVPLQTKETLLQSIQQVKKCEEIIDPLYEDDTEEYEESTEAEPIADDEQTTTYQTHKLVKMSSSSQQLQPSRNNSQKHELIYGELLFEEDNNQEQTIHQTSGSHAKKICLDQQHPQHPPTSQNSNYRDECTVFGEYIANELRFITSRDILVSVKHKINTALYEATTKQLQLQKR